MAKRDCTEVGKWRHASSSREYVGLVAKLPLNRKKKKQKYNEWYDDISAGISQGRQKN
jgi:hypothetical protein